MSDQAFVARQSIVHGVLRGRFRSPELIHSARLIDFLFLTLADNKMTVSAATPAARRSVR